MAQLRLATPDDAPILATLHAETVAVAYAAIFPADAPPPMPADLAPGYRALLTDPQATTWLVGDAYGRAVGAIALVADDAVPARRRIERFNVHPDYQSEGLGARLYRQAVATARAHGASRLNLWVLEDNSRARAIYERWGWTLVPGFTLANEPPDVIDVLYELSLS